MINIGAIRITRKLVGEAMESNCYFRIIQDLLAVGKQPYEKRFDTPFDGPTRPLGSETLCHFISSRDKSRFHQFGSKVRPGTFIGYALKVAEGWIGELI